MFSRGKDKTLKQDQSVPKQCNSSHWGWENAHSSACLSFSLPLCSPKYRHTLKYYMIHQRKPKSQPKKSIKCFSQHLSPHDKDMSLAAIWIPSALSPEQGQQHCGCCVRSASLKGHPCSASLCFARAYCVLTFYRLMICVPPFSLTGEWPTNAPI